MRGDTTHPDRRRRSQTNTRSRSQRRGRLRGGAVAANAWPQLQADTGLLQSLLADCGCGLSVSFNVLANISLVCLRSKPGHGASCHGDGGVDTTVRADVQKSAASGASVSESC